MAPVASRFETLVSGCPCGVIAHPWSPDSCIRGVAMIVRSSTLGTAPFVLLFYLAKMFLRGPQSEAGRREARLLPGRVLRTTMFGALLSGGIVTSMCLLRRLLGRFQQYTLAFIPGCVGGLAILTQKDGDLHHFLDAFFVASVEYGVRKAAAAGRRRGVATETLLFSALCGLLCLLQRDDHSGKPLPWFHWPLRRREEASELAEVPPAHRKPVWPLQGLLRHRHTECKHRGACLGYALHGVLRFAAMGSVLSLLRGLIPRARAHFATHPASVHLPPVLAWQLPAFLGAYVALFRVCRCSLCSVYDEDASLHSGVAGLLAGLSYVLHPSLSVFAAALASASELAWRRVAETGLVPRALVSCPRLVVVICMGFMVHARTLESAQVCPPVAAMMLTGCSRGRADELVANLRKILG